MVDYYVNVSTGDDDNDGTNESPVRSITKAIAFASELFGETGTIYVSPGIYESPNERFPMEIPPGFSLVGESSNLTRIRFAAETLMRDGSTELALGVVAVVVGRDLRRVTVEADPIAHFSSCQSSGGIAVINDDSVIDDVVLQPVEPFELNDNDNIREGFNFGIGVVANANLRFVRSRVHAPMALIGDGISVTNCSFESCELTVSGSPTIDNCTFSHIPRAATYNMPAITFYAGSATFGPYNNFDPWFFQSAVECFPGSSPLIFSCIFANKQGTLMRFKNASYPTLRSNVLGPGSPIWVEPGAAPLFEGNEFFANIRINGPADLGGGPRMSHGGNHFGPRNYPIEVDLPGGGVVFAMNNFWFSENPSEWVVSGAGTEVRTDGGMLDTLRTSWI